MMMALMVMIRRWQSWCYSWALYSHGGAQVRTPFVSWMTGRGKVLDKGKHKIGNWKELKWNEKDISNPTTQPSVSKRTKIAGIKSHQKDLETAQSTTLRAGKTGKGKLLNARIRNKLLPEQNSTTQERNRRTNHRLRISLWHQKWIQTQQNRQQNRNQRNKEEQGDAAQRQTYGKDAQEEGQKEDMEKAQNDNCAAK